MRSWWDTWRVVVVACGCVALVGCAGARVGPGPEAARAGAPVVAPPTTAAARRGMFADAHRRLQDGQVEQAAALFAVLVDSYPELQDYSLHSLASADARRGRIDDALAHWTQLSTTHPRSVYAATAALERGRILRMRGDTATARALLVSVRGGRDGGAARLATWELAEMDADAGDPRSAYALLMELREAVPGTALGKRAKQRVAELRENDPSLVPTGAALERELRLLLRESDWMAAIALADQLIARTAPADRPALLRLRADAEQGAGQLDAALATLLEVAQRYPDSAAAPEALYRRASLLWNRDRDAEAQQGFAEHRRRYPRDARAAEVVYAIARIDQAAGRDEAAAADFRALAQEYPQAAQAREARWRLGWIRYQQQRWLDAATAFEHAAQALPDSQAGEGRYWQARSLEHSGNRDAGRVLYQRILTDEPTSYYAHWAERRLGQASAGAGRILRPEQLDAIDEPPVAVDRYHLVRARELQAAGLRPLARGELQAFERDSGDSAPLLDFLIGAYPAADGYRDAIRLASRAGRSEPSVFYPLAFWPLVSRHTEPNGLDPLLVLSLMRQESLFDPAAHSPADARGLMQLLPSTATRVARSTGRPAPEAAQLYDPATNVELGVTHLSQLMQEYGGDPLKALAAYNGGEGAVAKWEERFGNLEPDEFVESITYRETRDYVKKVLANYRRYRQQYVQ